ncbi:MAG: homoserine kinase [Rickettsiales bacterium]|nr:homoserine kinase [Rickettsiales bacterium]|tara:strand:+ start:1938 stop:2900 length:963 start_codon:yes stop_codon:yes gene_type:complete
MAVYTEVSNEDLETFVSSYGIGSVLSFKGIAEGVENTNYLMHTEEGQFILTLYEKRVSPEDLPYFLNLMTFLANAGIPCPVPLHAKNGALLGELCGRPAAIVTFLNGMWPKKIKTIHCAELGTALARLHTAGAGFTMSRPNGLSINAWRPLFNESAAQADKIQPGLEKFLWNELDYLEKNWPGNLPTGICHADLFPDNVFFLGQSLSGLIDFYFACNDFLIYDLAICLNAWCFERDSSFNITKARSMLAAYRKERDISNLEILTLPIVARGAALRFLLTRLFDWLNHPAGALVKPKDPREYLSILQFHQRVSMSNEYGFD